MNTTATYRKTKQGQWVVFAPETVLQSTLTLGGAIAVHKRDGSIKHESLDRVGTGFVVDGVRMAYGYIKATHTAQSATQQPRRQSHTCDECGATGANRKAMDSNGISGLVCARCARQPYYCLSFG